MPGRSARAIGWRTNYRFFARSAVALWRDGVHFAVRHADPREAAELKIARAKEIAAREFDGATFVFLVPLDPALQ